MHPNDLVINDYVDDALDRDARTEVERHLTSCGTCRQLVDDLRDVRQRAGALEPIAPPVRAWKRIERELEHTGRSTGASHSRRWQWLALAAVLVLSTVVGVRSRW